MDDARLRGAALGPALDFDPFKPRAPWWGGDLQTLRNFLVRSLVRLEQFPSERIELPLADGSGDRLVGALSRPMAPPPRKLPLAILIHGLGGCEESFYLLKSAAHLVAQGYMVLRLNLRGAGPSRPLCRLQYHAGRTEDFADALAALPVELTAAGVVAVGYSLGGNMLLKYLGERGAAAALRAAVAVSAPLDLVETARHIQRWRNAAYQRYLLWHMQRESLAPGAEVSDGERRAIRSARTIWEFDDRFTAPRNGYDGAETYYARNGCGPFLDGVAVPTLVIQALDDPWIPNTPYLTYEWAGNRSLVPLLPAHGGHVGFQGSDRRLAWHDKCVGRFLAAVLGDGPQPDFSRLAASTAE
jgi:predicted alpha/beta-fold hydrolase